MIVYARLWECCQWPSPCYGGCDGGYYIDGCRCLDCRAAARSESDLRHARLCAHVRRTTEHRTTGDGV